MSSPTQRTNAYLAKRGWISGIVEKHLPFPKPFGTKQDFLGIIDVVACHPKHGILGIQTTSMSGTAFRTTKTLSEPVKPRLIAWIRAGGKFEIWGWSKRKQGNAQRWMLRRKRVTVALFDGNWTLQIHEWEAPEI